MGFRGLSRVPFTLLNNRASSVSLFRWTVFTFATQAARVFSALPVFLCLPLFLFALVAAAPWRRAVKGRRVHSTVSLLLCPDCFSRKIRNLSSVMLHRLSEYLPFFFQTFYFLLIDLSRVTRPKDPCFRPFRMRHNNC